MTAATDLPRFEKELQKELTQLTEDLEERWVGGPWHARDLPGDRIQWHTKDDLDRIAARGRGHLTVRLADWSGRLGPKRVQLLMFLWWECWQLWDVYLMYRTLRVVDGAVEEVTAAGGTPPDPAQPREDWEPVAWRAVGNAMKMITADAEVFKQINLSSAAGVAEAAEQAAATTKSIIDDIRLALAVIGDRQGQPDDDSALAADGLRDIEREVRQNQLFFEVLVDAAKALVDFEAWLAVAPRLGAEQSLDPVAVPHGSSGSSSHGQSVSAGQTLLASIDAAADHFRRATEEELTGVALAQIEPWVELLTEIREIATSGANTATSNGNTGSGGNTGTVRPVFVPRRVAMRYCYPFAVDADERIPPDDRPTHLGASLRHALRDVGIAAAELKPMGPLAFFTAEDYGSGLYGGVRVDLPDLELWCDQPPGMNRAERRQRCKAWVDLSLMGNHCLCIEPEPLDAPLPHLLYQALQAGTPFAVGATVALADLPAGAEIAWDNLHSFSRDIIAAAGEASVRGNLQEIVIARTDASLGAQPEQIAGHLDSAVGGRVLLRSIQRAATTLDEWVRYPPVGRAPGQATVPSVSGLPELGMAGDWCTHTGETTIFGVVAAPTWLSDAYAEAAQFTSSWSPVLRLWNRRLQNAIAAPGSGEAEDDYGEEIRRIEQRVRRHLSQIRAEELCATQAHRRFLDQLLEMSGIGRLQGELEAQLDAGERLTDWFSERNRRTSEAEQRAGDRRRDRLLGVIALFGLFELGTFLGLANGTNFHVRLFFVTVQQGVWEDWLMLALFIVALVVGFYFDFFGVSARLRGWLGSLAGNLGPRKRRSASRRGLASRD